MGTNSKKYLELWEIFEKELENKEYSLYEFSKQYGNENEEDIDKLYSKLKKMNQRKNSLKSPTNNTIMQLEDYVNFLKNYAYFEPLDDECYTHFFD